METKFQTSFIPKKPISSAPPSFTPNSVRRTVTHSGGGSLFMSLAIVLFILSAGALGGAYAWKSYLTKDSVDLQNQLNIKINQFNLDQISLIKAQSTKIALSRQILNSHLAMSNVFEAVGNMTAENTRFMSLEFTLPVSNQGLPGPMQIELRGYSKSFPSLAFQSDVLNELEKYNFKDIQLRSVIRNPIINDPTIGNNGTVQFGLTATLDPQAFSYVKLLNAQAQQ